MPQGDGGVLSQARPSKTGTGTVNGDAWAEEAAEEIRALEGSNWKDRVEWWVAEAGRRCFSGTISEAAYERVYMVAEARKSRTAAAKARHEHSTRKEDTLHDFVADTIAHLKPPPPGSVAAVAVVPRIKAGVRGPSRHTAEERAARADRRLDQVHMTGAPYQALTGLKIAARAVFSIIVLDCRTTAAGACERTVARIAGAAACSERAVQYAVRKLVERGLVAVEERRGRPNRITITSERVKTWGRRAERLRSILLEEQFSSQKEEKIKAPPWGANACVNPGEYAHQDSPEGQQSVPARVGARTAPRPCTGLETNPGGMRAAWDAMLDRANALVAAAARSSVTRDDPAPS